MHRRTLLCAMAALGAAPARAQDDDAAGRPRHKISAGQLHASLSARFPLRIGIEELLRLEIGAPRLHLLPERNRLGAGLTAQASGPVLQEPQAGEVDLSFGLRYDPADRSVRAHEPELLNLRLPGLPPDAIGPLQKVLVVASREALAEVVLYRFSAQELALADTMGFEPERLQVLDDGLMVHFAETRRR